MNLIGKEKEKLDYIIDIYTGTMLLNNFIPMEMSIKTGSNLRSDFIKDAIKYLNSLNAKGKFYFYGPTFNEGEQLELCGLCLGKSNHFRKCELVNVAVKILYNLNLYDILVNVDDEALIDDLESISLPVGKTALKKTDYTDSFVFRVSMNDKILIEGGGSDEKETLYFIINCDNLLKMCDYNKKEELDAYIKPLEQDVLSDAFQIATDLKDSGLKLEVDYELNNFQEDEIEATFLITFDKKDIANYRVHLKDLKTKEEREVMIDNLIEELSFI